MSDILMKGEDVATRLGIKHSTFRKYSAMFKKYGYEFHINNQGNTSYDEDDVSLFRDMLELRKQSGVTLDIAIQQVLAMSDVAATTDITTPVMSAMPDITAITDAMSDMSNQIKAILEQNSQVLNQNNALIKKVELLEDLEKKQISDRDKLLMESMRESRESKKLLMEVKAQNELIMKEMAAAKDEKKKSWWRFWE